MLVYNKYLLCNMRGMNMTAILRNIHVKSDNILGYYKGNP